MSKLSFSALTIAFFVCVALSAQPSAAFEQFWAKQHCNPTAQDTMHLQIYLKWSNQELLNNYVHHGDASGLPFDIESMTDIEETQKMWRFVLRPTQEARGAVQARLTAAGFLEGHCSAEWDSFHCKNVPVTAVAAMFGVEMCAYKQKKSAIVEAKPHLANLVSKGTFWLANVRKAALRNEHIQYVGGVALFDPTLIPQRHDSLDKKPVAPLRDAIEMLPYYWPVGLGNAPAILMGLGLPQFAPLSQLGVVQVALFCKDGRIANYTSGNSLLEYSCPLGIPYPRSLVVTIPETGATTTVNFDDTNCQNLGPFFGQDPYSNQAVCSINAHPVVPSLDMWGVYHVNASVVFSDNSVSNIAQMKNFWNGAYLSDMRVTYPNPMGPSDVRTLYNIDNTERLRNNESAQGILEFSSTEQPGRGFLLTDLRMYLVQYNVVSEAEVDAYLAKWLQQIGTDEYESRGETSLDIEMMMSLAQTGKTYLWNIVNGPGMPYMHWSQAFLAWGWNVTSGTGPSSALPSSVWSISYGGPEWDTPNDSAEDAEALNNYFKLLTASGVTVVVSSGDSGAGFFFGAYTQAPLASFPASSPYVVSVGASANHRDADTGAVVQSVCSAADGNVITSGGGFSAYYGTPSYQSSEVSVYVTNATRAGGSAPSGMRGLPDIAAIGAWVNIVMSAETIPVFGTSISAPVFSSLLSLANDQRRERGNGTVRLANWFVYRAPEGVFTDVTIGSNCAGEQYEFSANFPTYASDACYKAVKGWDPVSGLGTPMFPALATYALNWTASGIVLPTGAGTSGGSDNHAGVIAGAVIGGVVGLAILIFIVYKVTKKPAGADYTAI